MPQAIPALFCHIFQRALLGKPDDRLLKVQARDLLVAFGADVCRQAFHLDIAQVEQSVEQAVQQRLQELAAEIEELQEYAAAGFPDARKMLQGARREQREITVGVLRPKPLVPVLAGTLRQLIAERGQPKTTVATAKESPAPAQPKASA